MPESERLSHRVEGLSDVTAVLGLYDGRYREVRGDEYPIAPPTRPDARPPSARGFRLAGMWVGRWLR